MRRCPPFSEPGGRGRRLRKQGCDLVLVPGPVVANDQDHNSAFEGWDRARGRLGNVRLAAFRHRHPPGAPVAPGDIDVPLHRFQLPPRAYFVAVLAEDVGDRQPHRVGVAAPVVWGAESSANSGVPGTAGEGGSEGVGISNAGGEVGAYAR